MRKSTDLTNHSESAPTNPNQDYPDVLVPEDQEEENPTAYTLLSKIEDPYYTKSESTDPSKGSFHEGKANISSDCRE